MDEKLARMEGNIGKIQADMANILSWQRAHEEDNTAHFKRIDATINELPTRLDLAGLAKTKDVKEVLAVFNAVSMAITVTEKGGKWLSRSVLALAAFLIALAVIKAMAQGGLAALLRFVTF